MFSTPATFHFIVIPYYFIYKKNTNQNLPFHLWDFQNCRSSRTSPHIYIYKYIRVVPLGSIDWSGGPPAPAPPCFHKTSTRRALRPPRLFTGERRAPSPSPAARKSGFSKRGERGQDLAVGVMTRAKGLPETVDYFIFLRSVWTVRFVFSRSEFD